MQSLYTQSGEMCIMRGFLRKMCVWQNSVIYTAPHAFGGIVDGTRPEPKDMQLDQYKSEFIVVLPRGTQNRSVLAFWRQFPDKTPRLSKGLTSGARLSRRSKPVTIATRLYTVTNNPKQLPSPGLGTRM